MRGEPTVLVTASDSGITLDVGLLSTETGGDADGFIAAISIASQVGVVSKIAVTATVGALLKENTTDSGSATAPVRTMYRVGSTAVSISYTLSSGADMGAGYIELPYRIGLAA